MDYIRVQEPDFDINAEYQAMREDNREDGAIVFFVGQVREMNQGSEVTGLYLEHYPAMTEKSLQGIVEQVVHLYRFHLLNLLLPQVLLLL